MQLLRRNGAITLYFKVNIFRLSRQLEPGKVCGYVQIVDIDENLESRYKGLYIIGDGSGVTHSLSHASASGVYVARQIIENL